MRLLILVAVYSLLPSLEPLDRVSSYTPRRRYQGVLSHADISLLTSCPPSQSRSPKERPLANDDPSRGNHRTDCRQLRVQFYTRWMLNNGDYGLVRYFLPGICFLSFDVLKAC